MPFPHSLTHSLFHSPRYFLLKPLVYGEPKPASPMAIVRFFHKLGRRMQIGKKGQTAAGGPALDPLQTVGARRLYEVMLPYLNDRPILTAHHWAGAGGEPMDFRTVARGGDESGARVRDRNYREARV